MLQFLLTFVDTSVGIGNVVLKGYFRVSGDGARGADELHGADEAAADVAVAAVAD